MAAHSYLVWLVLCTVFALSLVVPRAGLCSSGMDRIKPVLDEITRDFYLDTDHPASDIRQQFVVFAKDGARAKEILAVAVKQRSRAQRFFGTSIVWDLPALILVYPDKTTYYRATGLVGTGGVQVQTRYKGKRVKLILTFEGEGLVEHTLPHELMHLLITDMSNRDYFSGAQPDLVITPVWIQEGLAEFLTADADRRADFERLVLWRLHQNKLIPLRRLLSHMGYEREIVLHYAESYSFVAFVAATMRERGRQRLRNYITSYNVPELAQDPIRNFTMAFQGAMPSIEALEKRWHAWIARYYERHFCPVVVKTLPADGARDVPTVGRILVKFSKPIDPATLNAETITLRVGDSEELAGQEDNLLSQATFTQDRSTTALRIDVPGGLKAEHIYTLVFSSHVRSKDERGLVTDRFVEMKRADWWKSNDFEPVPGQVREKDEADAEAEEEDPLEVVTTITFRTESGDTDDAGRSR
jgi:hypothetical protein